MDFDHVITVTWGLSPQAAQGKLQFGTRITFGTPSCAHPLNVHTSFLAIVQHYDYVLEMNDESPAIILEPFVFLCSDLSSNQLSSLPLIGLQSLTHLRLAGNAQLIEIMSQNDLPRVR